MKIRTTLFTLFLSTLLILLCGRKDTLYDPHDHESARCFALLSDTVIANPSLTDTSLLATCDTIHTTFLTLFEPALK
jgi:hypothetical protein